MTDESALTAGGSRRTRGSWQEKSWVVGVVAGRDAYAFDCNELVEKNAGRHSGRETQGPAAGADQIRFSP